MIINQKAKRLDQEAEFAWDCGDEEEAERLDQEVKELWRENERRLNAAKALFESFDQEAQDSGAINAGDSFANEAETITFGELKDEAIKMCEYWEMAAASAQFIADCR